MLKSIFPSPPVDQDLDEILKNTKETVPNESPTRGEIFVSSDIIFSDATHASDSMLDDTTPESLEPIQLYPAASSSGTQSELSLDQVLVAFFEVKANKEWKANDLLLAVAKYLL